MLSSRKSRVTALHLSGVAYGTPSFVACSKPQILYLKTTQVPSADCIPQDGGLLEPHRQLYALH